MASETAAGGKRVFRPSDHQHGHAHLTQNVFGRVLTRGAQHAQEQFEVDDRHVLKVRLDVLQADLSQVDVAGEPSDGDRHLGWGRSTRWRASRLGAPSRTRLRFGSTEASISLPLKV